MYDPYDEDYPQIVRSAGVAPFWRALAILGMIGVLGLGFFCFALVIALLRNQSNAGWGGTGPIAGPAPGALPFNPPVEDADGVDDVDEGAGPNPPFPLTRVTDLRLAPIAGEPPPKDRGPSPRQRFIDQANDLVWKGNLNDYSVTTITVSLDGGYLAVADQFGLKVGIPNDPASMKLVDENDVPLMRGGLAPGRRAAPRGAMGGPRKRAWRLAGVPSWTSGGKMYFASTDGKLRVYDAVQQQLRVLACVGDSPAVVPTDPSKLIYVRSKPVAKTDFPGHPSVVDPTEIVVAEIDGPRAPRVLVRASRRDWTRLVASPDGKRLALIASLPHEKYQYLTKRQLFVTPIDAEDLTPVTQPSAQLGDCAWLPDSSGLVYSRGHEALPADYWEEDSRWGNQRFDLFHYDLATTKETRLSRGGGFLCAGVDAHGMLYYRCDVSQTGSFYARLLKVDVKKAQDFAAREPKAVPRGVKEWTAVIEKTYRDAKVDASADRVQPTPELMAKLAETFSRAYREQFKAPAPANLQELDRQFWDLSVLEISSKERKRFRTVLAAVEGEYLRTHHGAEWRLGDGRIAANEDDSAQDNPFAFIVNGMSPGNFSADDIDDEENAPRYFSRLCDQVRNAAGRKLILTNDSAAARAAIDALTDPDLAKGAEFLRTGQNADALLKELVKKNPGNHFLAIHVARLLLDNDRRGAAADILGGAWEASILDPQKHNLLGVALLDKNPENAIGEFRKALECDPYYGPALLNLAQAFTKIADYASAEKCLREVVKRHPGDAQAADARRRLADLHARENVKR
jgi:tetratricopeptide (TPR) repeat protein